MAKVSSFTYTDPVTGQTQTVQVSPKQKHQLQQYLKQQAKAVKQARKAAANAPLNLPPIGMPASGAPTIPTGGGGYVYPTQPNVMTAMPSTCANACLPQNGWILPILSAMAAQSRFVVSLDPENSVFVNSTNPLALGYGDPNSLLQACMLAVQGNATKNFAQVLWPSTPADTSVTPTATPVFGLRVRITNSVLNLKFGTYVVNVLNGSTVQSTFNIVTRKLPIDIVVLSISNNAGVATVVPNAAPAVQFLAATNPALVPGSDVLYCETLNMRDIGTVLQQTGMPLMTMADTYDTYDGDGDDD